jgi:hypothetical protein
LLLAVAGFLPYLLVRMLTRRYLTVRGWPFCSRCIRLRRTRLAVAIVLFSMVPVGVAAAAAFGLATFTPANQAVGKVLLITTAVALLAAMVMGFASYPSVGGAGVSRDGHWLLVRRPSEAYERRIEQRLNAIPVQRIPAANLERPHYR